MKLLRSTKSNVSKDKKSEKVPHLEIAEGVLIHCNTVNNNYHSRIYHTFVPNQLFDQLLDIFANNFIFLKPFLKYKKWCTIQYKLKVEYL